MDIKGKELKCKLEKLLLQEEYDTEEALAISQELDKYIVAYYKSVNSVKYHLNLEDHLAI